METWGRIPWFYRGDGCEKSNRPPRSLGLPRAPPRHVTGHAPAIPILSHQNHVGRFVFLKRPDSFPTEGTWARKISSLIRLGP